jgi:hypothetical protein
MFDMALDNSSGRGEMALAYRSKKAVHPLPATAELTPISDQNFCQGPASSVSSSKRTPSSEMKGKQAGCETLLRPGLS